MSSRKGFIFRGATETVRFSAHGSDKAVDTVFAFIQEKGNENYFSAFAGSVEVDGRTCNVQMTGDYGTALNRVPATAELVMTDAPDTATLVVRVGGTAARLEEEIAMIEIEQAPVTEGNITIFA